MSSILEPNSAAPAPEQPFAGLGIDTVIDAIESLGFLSDLRILALNSYENRVYQVGIEDDEPVIAKFYRPQRWSDDQILEQHAFSLELAAQEIPVVPPLQIDGQTLFRFQEFRFSLAQRRGGHAPELDDLDTLYTLGQHLGRIHAVGQSESFSYRPKLNLQNYALDSREFILNHGFVTPSLTPAYAAISEQIIEKMRHILNERSFKSIRIHGDCHPGNIMSRPDSLYIVDLDDCRSGPAVQDLWMLITGEGEQRQRQYMELLEGYQEFCDFSLSELALIETLRTLRLMHYAAWLARRWSDPAFPMAFPWFNSESYWAKHIQELKEQLYILDQPSISLPTV